MIHTVKKQSVQFAKLLHDAHIDQDENLKVKLNKGSGEVLQTMFLGTKGKNAPYFEELLSMALKGNVEFRNSYYPDDPDYINKELQDSKEFIASVDYIREEYKKLIKQLQKSGPFFSMRSVGHMLWDTTIPGMLGYFAALLYNQNNVAAEASPVTTIMELEVGNDLCKMLGYTVQPIHIRPNTSNVIVAKKIIAWGHITCDGSVANLEGLWAARNLKFYPVSLKAALLNEPQLQAAKNYEVTLLNGKRAVLISLDSWTLLNLKGDDIMNIPNEISKQYNIKATLLGSLIANYTVQSLGLYDMLTKYLPDIKNAPVSMGPATKHYSWPKGAAILGIGYNNMLAIKVDKKARMDLTDLRVQLDQCLTSKTPVMNVIAVIGSTEESAVDPLKDILALRDEYRLKGFEFAIHADAAWGGYFASMLNNGSESDPAEFERLTEDKIKALPLSKYATEQYKVLKYADSITIDPHKAGYVPYPAGALCYRNSAMRNLVAFTAPVVFHGGVDPTVGVYGVEGSKPGAAAAAVYFSHQVIRPNSSGYGELLGNCLYNSKRFYAALVTLNIENRPFIVVPLTPIPAEQGNEGTEKIRQQYEYIKNNIVNKTDAELDKDKDAFALFKELGQDQTITTYMFNFYNDDGTLNSNIDKLNELNTKIYKKFSFSPGEENLRDTEIVVTSSEFDPDVYGDEFMEFLKKRLGIIGGDSQPIDFLISTIMNPWLSKTVEGSFIPMLIDIITVNVEEIIKKVKNQT